MGKSTVCPVCGEKIPESQVVTTQDGRCIFTCPQCGKHTIKHPPVGRGGKICPVCGEPIPSSARVTLPEGAYAIVCPNCGKSTTYFPDEPDTPNINS